MASAISRRAISHSKSFSRYLCTNSTLKNPEFEEISIPVPWGHIAGKLWGPTRCRPILLLHGWQDNAGSFDRLIPQLPTDIGYMAIDLPGHGRSSHIPDGFAYNINDTVHIINLIREHYGWDKVSLMGHSLGSKLNFMYGALNTDICDLLVGIDLLKPNIRPNTSVIKDMKNNYANLLRVQHQKLNNTLPPTYTRDQLVSLLVKGTNNSITRAVAPYILERGAKESPQDRNRFYVVRDNRIKYFGFSDYPQDLVLDFIKLLKTPYLFIKASNAPYYEDKKYYDEAIEMLQKENPGFEYVMVDGTHHVHLTEPEKISKQISEFICKHRKQ